MKLLMESVWLSNRVSFIAYFSNSEEIEDNSCGNAPRLELEIYKYTATYTVTPQLSSRG
jgi:hypothetical protein